MAISATTFPTRIGTVNNISPLTYRDGVQYLEQLEDIRRYINENMRPEFNGAIAQLIDEMNAAIANAELTTTESLAAWLARFDLFIQEVTAEIALLNDEAVADLIVDELSAVRTALDLTMDAAYVRRGELVFDVRDYGARPGTGDVTVAVQAAVDALNAAGGGILGYYEPGDYFQDGHVVIPDNFTLEMGPNSWIRKRPESNTYVVFVALAGLTTGYSGRKNIEFVNANMRGNLGQSVSINPLSAHRASGITIRGGRFWECAQNGHVFDLQGCENVLIEGNDIRGIKKIAGRAYTEAIQLDSSVSTGTGFASTLVVGEFFDGTPTRKVVVRNNYFGPITANGVTYPGQSPVGSHSYVDGRPYTDIVITGNTFDNIVETDGGYPGIIHFVAAQDVKITNNKVYSDGAYKNTFVRFFRGGNAIPFNEAGNPNAVTAPPTIKINPKNVTVEGNEITNLDSTGPLVWVYGESGWTVPNLLISNNRFVDCQRAAGSSTLIQATWTEDAQVINNRANNCGFGVVTVGTSEAPTISGNVGNGGAGLPVNVYDCVNPVLSGNRFRRYTSWVQITGSSNIRVSNNEVVVIGNIPAFKIISPPPAPTQGYIHFIGNTMTADNATPADSDSGLGLSTGYTAGLIDGNLAQNYVVAVDTSAGVTYGNNVAAYQ